MSEALSVYPDGVLELPDGFDELEPRQRVIMLRDWIYELSLLYDQAIVEMRKGATPASATKELDTSV